MNDTSDPIQVRFTPSREAGEGYWSMTGPERTDPLRLDARVRIPFGLRGAEGRLGLFQVDPRLKIATAEIVAREPLHIVGSDADNVPKKCCLVTLDGQGRFRYKGGRPAAQHLSDRHVALCRPDEPEMKLEFAPGARARVAVFMFDPATPLADDPHPGRPLEYQDARTTILQRIAADVLNCPYVGDAQRLFLQSRILEAQAVLMQVECTARLSARDRLGCERARAMLLDNLESPPGLPEIAAAVGMSPTRLKILFKRHFGKSFTALLMDERLERARVLLESGELRVEEVAWRCGYGHVSNFSRAFTRRYGLPPTRWLGRRG